jgi:hypothetical protein
MSKETGGPAFPYSGVHKGDDANHIIDSHGMTLRDYFAAKAMQGILANSGQLDNLNANAVKWVVRDSFLMADAMLKARAE